MSTLAKLMICSVFWIVIFISGLIIRCTDKTDFGHMVKTSDGLIASWNGIGNIQEAAEDENKNSIFERWAMVAWEKSFPKIEITLSDKNEDNIFESSYYRISKISTLISDIELNVFSRDKKDGTVPDSMFLALNDKNGNAKVKYFDLDFDGFWDFMEQYVDNSKEPMKFLWWQDRWQAVTEADGSKPDHIGQWILVDGKKVPMKWENGVWNEAK